VLQLQSIGIDLGTTYTKTSNERIFPSGISENIYLSNNVMEVEGKKYAMGLNSQKAILDTNINKSLNRNARLNFIYALFQDAQGNDCMFNNVTVGLPCSQWKNDETVNQFKQILDISDLLTVSVNGLEKRIFVETLHCIPEGASAYFAPEMRNERFCGRKVLLLDYGGITLNQILIEDDSVVDLHTDEFGILKVYKEMAEKITSDIGIDVKMEDMLDILKYGLSNKGEIIDVSDIIKPIALSYCNQVYTSLKLRWSIDNIPFVPMVGAGSITMYRYLKEYVPHIELQDNPQLLAAIGMREGR
jgi:hypothetical protein